MRHVLLLRALQELLDVGELLAGFVHLAVKLRSAGTGWV